MLGATVANKLFGAESAVEKKVRVNGVPMRVVGVRQSLGRLGGEDMDDHVFVPINTVRTDFRRTRWRFPIKSISSPSG